MEEKRVVIWKTKSRTLLLTLIVMISVAVRVRPASCDDVTTGSTDQLITRIDIKGATSMPEELLSRAVGITTGMRYEKESLEVSCSRLLKLYGDSGYPWAKVNVYVREDNQSEGYEVLFSLEEGRRARFDEVLFAGNRITRTQVLERQLGVRKGDLFSIAHLEEGRKKLRSWDLYDEVLEPKVYEESNPYRVSVLVPIRESRPNLLSGMLGFGSGREGTRKVWGNVNFLMRNISGTARRFELRWSQASVDERSLVVSYREPWLAGSPVAADLSYAQRLRDGVFMQMEFGAGFSAVFSDLGRAGAGFSHERIYPHGEGDTQYGTSEKNSVTASLDWTGNRMSDIFPRLEQLDLGVSYGVRTEEGETANETIVSSELVTPVWGRRALQVRVHAGMRAAFRSGDQYPAYLTVPFGGSHTVRGHRDGELYILRGVWAQNELLLLRGGGSDFHLFLDQAVTSSPVDDSTLVTSHLSGFGGGIRAQTGAGLLELDLALTPGKGFGEARIHVGFREEF